MGSHSFDKFGVAGALFSEVLKLLIEETKKFKDFKPLAKDLAKMVETWLPMVKQIESMQDFEELKYLKDVLERAVAVVKKCPHVEFLDRSKVTREIEEINKDLLKFCQVQVPLIMLRNQGLYAEAINNNLQTILRNQKLYAEAINNNLKMLAL